MTIYCELGFHTNKKDCDEFIHNPEIVGKALPKGLCKYLGVTFVDNTVAAQKEQTYTLEQFVKDVQKACGATVDGKAGSETLSKTVTLSASKNQPTQL